MRHQRSFAAAASVLAAISLTGCNPTKAVSDPISGTYTGTQRIELGPSPEEATHIRLDLDCLSAGSLVVADGDEFTCTDPEKATTNIDSSIQLSPGEHSIEVTAKASSVRYKVTAVYENGTSLK
jgi:hypothetical protein